MSRTRIIILAILAGVAVIAINVIAMNANKKTDEHSNGVANKESSNIASETDTDYEEGGSFDINGVEQNVTVSGLSDVSENSSSSSAIDEGYYNSATVSDIENPDTDYGSISDMEESNANAVQTKINNAGNSVSQEVAVTTDEMTQYKDTIIVAAGTAKTANPRIYKSELIALAMILGHKGADKENYEYNNYFGIKAKSYDDNSVSVMKTDMNGQNYKEIIRSFESADECFDYISKQLIKAGACSPKTFKQTVKALWNRGYLTEEWQISDFIRYSKIYGGLDEYSDLSDIPYDIEPASLLRG